MSTNSQSGLIGLVLAEKVDKYDPGAQNQSRVAGVYL